MPNPIKTLLKLLLLVTMVVEPVLLSYTMAGVGHQHSGFGMTSELKQEHGAEHSSSSHHSMHMMHDTAAHHVNMEDSGEMENCCATPACAAAAMQSLSILDAEIHTPMYTALHVSWKAIVLPSDTKPPRQLLV